MSTLYVKILAAAALILAATTLRAQNTFRITGTVTDAATGQPVAGVVVKLTDAAGEIAAYDTTDDKGAYTILRTQKPGDGYSLVRRPSLVVRVVGKSAFPTLHLSR